MDFLRSKQSGIQRDFSGNLAVAPDVFTLDQVSTYEYCARGVAIDITVTHIGREDWPHHHNLHARLRPRPISPRRRDIPNLFRIRRNPHLRPKTRPRRLPYSTKGDRQDRATMRFQSSRVGLQKRYHGLRPCYACGSWSSLLTARSGHDAADGSVFGLGVPGTPDRRGAGLRYRPRDALAAKGSESLEGEGAESSAASCGVSRPTSEGCRHTVDWVFGGCRYIFVQAGGGAAVPQALVASWRTRRRYGAFDDKDVEEARDHAGDLAPHGDFCVHDA